MDSGIAITDLGLNDFRMDLVNYIKNNEGIKNSPTGMHTVVSADLSLGIKQGIIYVLKNINSNVNIDNTNQLHPFYLVYIDMQGNVLCNHLNVKKTLDILRSICRGKTTTIKKMYELFNAETNEGKDMSKYSNLLNSVVASILKVKDEGDVDSLFTDGGLSALNNNIKGIEDFELISFIVIK